MLGGSFFAGNIPLAFQFSEERLRLISTFGSGMLVGTALIVIIPEGVETLYSVQIKRTKSAEPENPYPKAVIDSPAESRTSPLPHIPVNRPPSAGRDDGNPWDEREEDGINDAVARVDGDTEQEQNARHNHRPHAKPDKRSPTLTHLLPRSEHSHSHSTSEMDSFEAHRYIGAALAIGFAFMFLVDQVGHFGHSHNSQSHIVAVNDFRDRDNMYANTKIAATIGLVVHAAADGIALGAATASDRGSLGFIVFLAIMLHKAPSAFGLATFLLQEGHPRRVVRQHLLVFSLAAPIASLFTYIVLQQNGVEDPDVMRKWTGILLLFSAGTF
ncbi:hypothetical protein HK097_001584, partial [Rhizophlyctis rosea]